MTSPREAQSHIASRASRESTARSNLLAFGHGTGLTIYKNLLLPAILNARHEVILTTCFWAPSETLDELVLTLRELSTRVCSIRHQGSSKIKVYICFSSRSAIQKLFHTSSTEGYVYPPDKWSQKLGLPPSNELPGLDITVKSLFFRPFSVLHSKYLIIDRQVLFLPSCNVSWEDWYECAVGLRGPVAQDAFEFWKDIWRPAELTDVPFEETKQDGIDAAGRQISEAQRGAGNLVKCTLLPHLHDSSLQQALWFIPGSAAHLPPSRLNEKLLELITHAKEEVILLTPNFTSQAAFTAICFALLNGAQVHLITDRRMMVPEQLATAGVMTEQFVDRLIKEYQGGFAGRKLRERLSRLGNLVGKSLPEDKIPIGKLKVSYFRQPTTTTPSHRTDVTPQSSQHEARGIASRATKSHIKLTLIDRQSIILGSGNMDRASWRTSQELGVLIEDDLEVGDSGSCVESLWKQIETGLEGCLEDYFDG